MSALCVFQSFPINQVEAHAGECVGSFGLVEDNTVEVCPVNDISDTELSTNESKSDDYTLLNCISDLKENGLKLQMETIRVTVRRKMVWEDFKRARYQYYQPDRLLKVTFAGEPAVDDSSYIMLDGFQPHELRGPHAEDYHQIHELRGSRGSSEGCNPSLNRNTLPPGAT